LLSVAVKEYALILSFTLNLRLTFYLCFKQRYNRRLSSQLFLFMNSNWKNFLLADSATFVSDTHITFPVSDGDNRLYPIAHLAVLTVSGQDAGQFLQGQITCNINDITANQGSLGAMCNVKGRAITTFLLVKSGDDFLLVLPKELLQSVKQRLQKYVLRSKVTLIDSSDSLCLLGLTDTSEQIFLATSQQDNFVRVSFVDRTFLIADVNQAIALWSGYRAQGFQAADSTHWQTLDIVSGIPWLTLETSEEFIPQMLNLDKLGGISFTKGCYTGQEIVARTHYLGKTKRALFVASCETATPTANASIIDSNGQVVGNVLCAQDDKLLIVLQLSNTDTAQLRLKDYNQAPLILLTAEIL
jgi:folate-binding protein YgfZ